MVIGTDCIGSRKSNYNVPYDHDHDGPFIPNEDFLKKQVWTQKCAVQKASVDVNISYYYLKKKPIHGHRGPGFFLIKN